MPNTEYENATDYEMTAADPDLLLSAIVDFDTAFGKMQDMQKKDVFDRLKRAEAALDQIENELADFLKV